MVKPVEIEMTPLLNSKDTSANRIDEERRLALIRDYNRARVLPDGSRMLVEIDNRGYVTQTWPPKSKSQEWVTPSVSIGLKPPWVLEQLDTYKGSIACSAVFSAAAAVSVYAYTEQSVELLVPMMLVALIAALIGKGVYEKESAAWNKIEAEYLGQSAPQAQTRQSWFDKGTAKAEKNLAEPIQQERLDSEPEDNIGRAPSPGQNN